MKLLITCLAATLLAWASFGKGKEENPIILDPEETLHIILIDNINMHGDMYSGDRFYYFEQTLKEVMQEMDFPMAFKVERFGARPPRSEPELRVFLNEWGPTRFGDVEVRLSAHLKQMGERNRFGHYYSREGIFGTFSNAMLRKRYNTALKESLKEMVAKLRERVAVRFELEDGQIEPEPIE